MTTSATPLHISLQEVNDRMVEPKVRQNGRRTLNAKGGCAEGQPHTGGPKAEMGHREGHQYTRGPYIWRRVTSSFVGHRNSGKSQRTIMTL
jgi:hypothetical protein